MDEQNFKEELERMKQDIESFARPLSPCEYFHGREKRFGVDQLKRAVALFLGSQQKKFEG